jgi:hypothetical protein
LSVDGIKSFATWDRFASTGEEEAMLTCFRFVHPY